jgi:hypothetical protein
MRWRIYYEDGSTFSDRDGDAFHAPPAGVQVIAREDPSSPRGFRLLHGAAGHRDAFYWKAGDWYGCDMAGLWDHLLMYVGPKAILLGRTIRNEDFYSIKARAMREGLGEAP